MGYRRFEHLAIVLGVAAVSAATLLSLEDGLTVSEVLPELLLLAVFIGAVHWGRRGGFATAAVAALVDVAYSMPSLMQDQPSWAAVGLLVARLAAYGIIGILGGEVCVRVKHAFHRLENEGAFDEWSLLYNQRFFGRQLDIALARWERYSEPASVVLLTLAQDRGHPMRPSRQKAVMREIAAEMLDRVRGTDVVARLDDGRFALLLPHTPRCAGDTVASRVRTSVRLLAGVSDDALRAVVLGLPEDLPALQFLVRKCSAAGVTDQGASGSYSSAGVSTLNPAPDNMS